MQQDRNFCAVYVCTVLAFVFIFSANALAAGEVTIAGWVNADYQIVGDDGEVYEVMDTKLGNEVVQFVGFKVKVVGMVEEIDGQKVITITSYEIVGETAQKIDSV